MITLIDLKLEQLDHVNTVFYMVNWKNKFIYINLRDSLF